MVLLSFYFSVHIFIGDSGLSAMKQLELQHNRLSLRAKSLSSQRQLVETRIDALRRLHIDPDLLEEVVRNKLGFAHPDDIIVLMN